METHNLRVQSLERYQAALYFQPMAEDDVPISELPCMSKDHCPTTKAREPSADDFQTPQASLNRNTGTLSGRLKSGVPLDPTSSQFLGRLASLYFERMATFFFLKGLLKCTC
jgi:hypothetical protein